MASKIGNAGTLLVALMVMLVFPAPGLADAGENTYTIKQVTGTAALGGTITIEIPNLTKRTDKTHDLCKSVLYLADRQLAGINPRSCHTGDELQFDLKRTEASKEAWAAILGAPNALTRTMPVAVGFEDGSMLASGGSIDFTLINPNWAFWFCLLFFLFAVVLFFWLVVSSNILRDSGPEPGAGRKTFSLGRTQMAVWFFIILGSYLLIWIITGDREVLPASALVLIGISSGTALGAVVIDSSKRAEAGSQIAALTQERTALTERVAQLQALGAAAADEAKRELIEKNARLPQLDAEMQVAKAKIASMRSEGFFLDILTDENGISLHRFQISIWTVVLVVVFLASVYNSLAMPEFNSTLLALMGISNGTYIGFKFPEKQS